MGLEYITQPQVFTAPISALQGIAGVNEAYPLLTTYQYWTSTAVVNTSSFPIPGIWTMLDTSGSFIVAVSGILQPATRYTIDRNNRFVNFNFVISAGTEVAFTQLATNAPSSQSFNYIESVSAAFYNLSALSSNLKDVVATSLTANQIVTTTLTATHLSGSTITTNYLSALSATIQILDVTGYENSGLTVLGNLTINGNVSGNNLRTSFNLGSATGDYSFAEGFGYAQGAYSHAEGFGTSALNAQSHAEGYLTLASEAWSHAEGSNTKASGQASHAEGANSVASGQASHAEGSGYAEGDFSHSEGVSRAFGDYSHAAGTFAVAAHNNSFNWTGDSNLLSLTNGVSTTRADQFMVSAQGGIYLPGNVGIGTDNNSNALTVKGTISATNNIIAPNVSTLYYLDNDRSSIGISVLSTIYFDQSAVDTLQAFKHYEVEYNLYYAKNTTSNLIFGLSTVGNLTFINAFCSHLSANVAPNCATLGNSFISALPGTVVPLLTTGTLVNNGLFLTRIVTHVETGANTTTLTPILCTQLGTITPKRGSYRKLIQIG